MLQCRENLGLRVNTFRHPLLCPAQGGRTAVRTGRMRGAPGRARSATPQQQLKLATPSGSRASLADGVWRAARLAHHGRGGGTLEPNHSFFSGSPTLPVTRAAAATTPFCSFVHCNLLQPYRSQGLGLRVRVWCSGLTLTVTLTGLTLGQMTSPGAAQLPDWRLARTCPSPGNSSHANAAPR